MLTRLLGLKLALVAAAAGSAPIAGCAGTGLEDLLAADFDVAGGSVDYTGTWKLNPSKSQFPQHRGGQRGGPGGPGGFAGEVRITQTAQTITLSFADRSVVLNLDGSVQKRDLGDGREASIRAGWRDGSLVIERSGPRGGVMTEVYLLSGDGAELRINMTSTKNAATAVRVFDRL